MHTCSYVGQNLLLVLVNLVKLVCTCTTVPRVHVSIVVFCRQCTVAHKTVPSLGHAPMPMARIYCTIHVSEILSLTDHTLYRNSYAVVVGSGRRHQWDYVKGHPGQSGINYPEVCRLSDSSPGSGRRIFGGSTVAQLTDYLLI